MKKQTVTVHNAGNQESTVDIILHLEELGFSVKCAMAELASSIEAEREFAEHAQAHLHRMRHGVGLGVEHRPGATRWDESRRTQEEEDKQ